jgi:hypothetical protein
MKPGAECSNCRDNFGWKEKARWMNGLQFKAVRGAHVRVCRLLAGLGLGQGADDGNLEALTVQGFEHHHQPEDKHSQVK